MTAARLARTAALALMFAPGLLAVAHADDEYGTATGHEALIRQAASSAMLPMAAAPQWTARDRFAAGQNDNFGAPQGDQVIRQSATRGSSSALVDVAQAQTSTGDYMPGGGYRLPDLVGAGGRQDELAQEIYRPGTGTDF